MTAEEIMSTNQNLISTVIGGSIILILIILLFALAAAIVCLVAEWKLFKKAGKKGWEAIVPFYNSYVLIEIAGLNWWYFLILISGTILSILGVTGLSLVTTLAGCFVNFLVFYNVAKKTKQNEILFGILGAFVTFVPTLILGFSNKIVFDNTVPVSPNGIIGDKKN